MRMIGPVGNAKDAQRFVAFLAKEGIEAEVREDDDEVSVWAYHDEQLDQSRNLLSQFQSSPQDKRFDAPKLTLQIPKGVVPTRSRYVDVRTEIFGASNVRNVVTIAFIVISVVITIMIQLPPYQWIQAKLMYSEYIRPAFYEISQGQVWRLVTPIFMHAGIFHILFNMMWLHMLGGQIEQHEGSRFLLLLVLIVACLVNTAQFLVSGPGFLGMSGVVYALFGYVWMMVKFKAGSRYELSDSTIKILVAWLFICLVLDLSGVMRIANTQHFVGTGIGAAYGYLRAGGLRTYIRRVRYRRKLK